jgi:hypothetical protein
LNDPIVSVAGQRLGNPATDKSARRPTAPSGRGTNKPASKIDRMTGYSPVSKGESSGGEGRHQDRVPFSPSTGECTAIRPGAQFCLRTFFPKGRRQVQSCAEHPSAGRRFHRHNLPCWRSYDASDNDGRTLTIPVADGRAFDAESRARDAGQAPRQGDGSGRRLRRVHGAGLLADIAWPESKARCRRSSRCTAALGGGTQARCVHDQVEQWAGFGFFAMRRLASQESTFPRLLQDFQLPSLLAQCRSMSTPNGSS